jgi:urease accessory protein UreH
VLLVSQAALQVHPGTDPNPAVLESSYDVAANATLDCFWDPLIPFANSRLQQRIDLRVAAGGELYWSDALMSGRAARGEAWHFDRLDHELRMSVGDQLRYLERYVLAPQSRDPAHLWSAAHAHYAGTTIVHADAATPARAEQAQQRIAALAGVQAGVDCLAPQLVVARLLAARGPQFSAARALLREAFDRPACRRP